MAEQELTPAQKAATVIVAIGTEKASRIYQYMDSEELEQLTIEVAKLGYIDPEQTEQTLEDFYRSGSGAAVEQGHQGTEQSFFLVPRQDGCENFAVHAAA